MTECDKLNIAALGNAVPQLHVHVIARFRNDRRGRSRCGASTPPRTYEREELHNLGHAAAQEDLAGSGQLVMPIHSGTLSKNSFTFSAVLATAGDPAFA